MPTRFWGSRAHISNICVTQIPNRTFATPYVSTPFLSHARSYMGDVSEEDGEVRGILVASGFDAKAKTASRMVPSLILRKYDVRFTFLDPWDA